jgi:di/tricarboxylate transporter
MGYLRGFQVRWFALGGAALGLIAFIVFVLASPFEKMVENVEGGLPPNADPRLLVHGANHPTIWLVFGTPWVLAGALALSIIGGIIKVVLKVFFKRSSL